VPESCFRPSTWLITVKGPGKVRLTAGGPETLISQGRTVIPPQPPPRLQQADILLTQ
jgi:hypothetical protein